MAGNTAGDERRRIGRGSRRREGTSQPVYVRRLNLLSYVGHCHYTKSECSRRMTRWLTLGNGRGEYVKSGTRLFRLGARALGP